MTIRRQPLAIFAATAIALVGCTLPSYHGAGSSGAASSATETPDGRSAPKQACDAIVTCVVACPKGDVPCESACIEQGSPTAQEKFKAFDACLVGSTCQTVTCVQAECDSQIRACIEDAPPVAPNPNPPSPQALSQQDLAGTWENIDPSEGKATSFTFSPGGTYRKVYVYTDPSPQCLVFKKRTIVDTGTVQVTGDTLTARPDATLQTMVSCSGNESGKETISFEDVFTFSVSNNTLTLTDKFTSKIRVYTKK